MSAARPALADRVRRKLRWFFMRSELDAYLATMSADNPLRGLPVRIVGDASADPTESFTHYDAFGYWIARHLARGNRRRRILDIGSPKTQNAILSASHDVTALVLADCSDSLSAVNYVRHDVTRPLPFPDGAFDCITSTVSLNLVGLGRYGDRVDADAIPNLIGELSRVAAPGAQLLVSLPLGPNMLAYNNHWCFDLEQIQRLCKGWRLAGTLVDGWSSPKAGAPGVDASHRFVKPEELPPMQAGDYRVTFCDFVRDRADT
jgi:SAM-dependent methyltransferase